MKRYIDLASCTGCSACLSTCPTGAISMQSNREGFLYPVIDDSKCVKCGRCSNVCPLKNSVGKSSQKTFYAGHTKDDELLKASTSGGVFGELAKYVLARGGVVYGAAFKDDFTVHHVAARSQDDVHQLRGSKYVQSNLELVFKDVLKDLSKHVPVLFVGTHCQVAGLKSFLSGDYECLYTIDLLCHGVPPQKLWIRYLRELAHGRSVERVSFRKKDVSWKESNLRVEFSDGSFEGTSMSKPGAFFRAFVDNYCLRPSCYACRFKGGASGGDISLGDHWNIKHDAPYYKEMGNSVIVANTDKARRLLNEISDRLDLYVIDEREAFNPHSLYYHSARRSPYRGLFMSLSFLLGLKRTLTVIGWMAFVVKVINRVARRAHV